MMKAIFILFILNFTVLQGNAQYFFPNIIHQQNIFTPEFIKSNGIKTIKITESRDSAKPKNSGYTTILYFDSAGSMIGYKGRIRNVAYGRYGSFESFPKFISEHWSCNKSYYSPNDSVYCENGNAIYQTKAGIKTTLLYNIDSDNPIKAIFKPLSDSFKGSFAYEIQKYEFEGNRLKSVDYRDPKKKQTCGILDLESGNDSCFETVELITAYFDVHGLLDKITDYRTDTSPEIPYTTYQDFKYDIKKRPFVVRCTTSRFPDVKTYCYFEYNKIK